MSHHEPEAVAAPDLSPRAAPRSGRSQAPSTTSTVPGSSFAKWQAGPRSKSVALRTIAASLASSPTAPGSAGRPRTPSWPPAARPKPARQLEPRNAACAAHLFTTPMRQS